MAWYNISSDTNNPQPPRTATIINQFGTVNWEVFDSHYLLVPSIKNGIGGLSGFGNHWKCYDAVPQFFPSLTFINLEDQFGPQTVIPLEAPGTLLCNPVDKDGEGIPMPQEHLACYPLGFPDPVNQLVALDNQFGTFINVAAGTPDLFCLPSQKLFETPTPIPTPTPTPTAAMPTPTAVTPTPTAVTPTPTAPPAGVCGNGIVEGGEDCDAFSLTEGRDQCLMQGGNFCVASSCICGSIDFNCTVDKKCSVGGAEPADECEATFADEVTYTYIIGPLSVWDELVTVNDDLLGEVADQEPIPAFEQIVVTATTTLFETTTNTAEVTSPVGYGSCVFGSFPDSVTVTVAAPTPTEAPLACDLPISLETVCTDGGQQNKQTNAKVSHCITAEIPHPRNINNNTPTFQVCCGSPVTIVVFDATGTPTTTITKQPELGSLVTNGSTRVAGSISGGLAKYESVSSDGTDIDRMSITCQSPN
jgi:hypothetical protein